jgi:hypothetical protein
MGNVIVKHSVRFVLFILVQVLILNFVEPGWGIYPMLYPLFIMLLPFELGTVWLMAIAFATGFAIDRLSNSYGLHASAAVAFAYARPAIFKLFEPRDGYEPETDPSVYGMGTRWFFSAYGILLLIHQTWYFLAEHFNMNEWLLLLRIIALNTAITFVLSLLVQFIFVSRRRSER